MLERECPNDAIFELPIGPIHERHGERERLQLEAGILVEVAVDLVELYILAFLKLVFEFLDNFLEDPAKVAPGGEQLHELVFVGSGHD